MYGWTPEHCLEMPAVRFFALLNSGRKHVNRDKALQAVAMCDASSISLADSKYFEQLRTYYVDLAMGPEAVAKRNRSKAMDPSDPATVQLITNIFETASRLN